MPDLNDVIILLRELRDDWLDEHIDGSTRMLDDLGMDSLDAILLARALRKRHGVELEIEQWQWQTQPLSTVLDHLSQDE